MPDQTGKTIIVTGANSGLGLASAKKLSQKGATVILACRSEERGQQAAQEIARTAATPPQVLILDLADLRSIRDFAAAFLDNHDRLDVLLNNAGIMATPYGTTRDGFEQQIGVNHLGHFALTGLLIDRLRSTPQSRIVHVSSLAARNGTIQPETFCHPSDYKPWPAYNQSKLANLMFTRELHRRLAGTDIRVLAAHPGGASTNLGRHVDSGPVVRWLAERVLLPLLPSAEQNAAPQLMAATAPGARSDTYYGPGGFGQIKGAPRTVHFPKTIGTPEDWQRLWSVSEHLTGVQFLS